MSLELSSFVGSGCLRLLGVLIDHQVRSSTPVHSIDHVLRERLGRPVEPRYHDFLLRIGDRISKIYQEIVRWLTAYQNYLATPYMHRYVTQTPRLTEVMS